MAATTTRPDVTRKFLRSSGKPVPEPLRVRVLAWTILCLTAGLLLLGFLRSWPTFRASAPELLLWLPIVVLTDLMPVTLWNSVQLTTSQPVLLAAAMLYSPVAAGVLAFVGTSDVREIRKEISLLRALLNRSNVALSVVAASWLFHALGGSVEEWPTVIGLALLVLVADMAINNGLTIYGFHLLSRLPLRELAKQVYGRGRPVAFLLGYGCLGLLAVLLATVYESAGPWSLMAFSIPVFLARQMFMHGSKLSDASQALSEKDRMLLSVTERIASERQDERLSVASGLHDEVLPPLYKVHLMGQVLRQDLATGRLLALEEDLPDLLRATEAANDAMRLLIRDLRQSSLGPHGLSETLRLLVRHLQDDTRATLTLQVEEVGGSPLVQLLAYQVAREALVNAVRHARAATVVLRLVRDASDMRLVVEDDGCGFDPSLVDREKHFGLQLMKERVELAGGTLFLESSVGLGTVVTVRLPAETSG